MYVQPYLLESRLELSVSTTYPQQLLWTRLTLRVLQCSCVAHEYSSYLTSTHSSPSTQSRSLNEPYSNR